MYRNEVGIAGGDDVAVRDRRPVNRPFGVALTPWALEKTVDTEPVAQRWRPGRVINVPVRDEHLMESRPAQRLLDLVEVSAFSSSGVDERRQSASNEPGPVSVARNRPGVEREDRDRVQKNTFNRA
jgi:hypothetical protein